MVLFLLGLYGGGGRRRTSAKGGGGSAGGRQRWLEAAAQLAVPRRPAVRQLYWKLRSRWRRSSAPSRPNKGGAAATARFAYDLESYSRNFDDGLVSGLYS